MIVSPGLGGRLELIDELPGLVVSDGNPVQTLFQRPPDKIPGRYGSVAPVTGSWRVNMEVEGYALEPDPEIIANGPIGHLLQSSIA
jgi:hypothetical protein